MDMVLQLICDLIATTPERWTRMARTLPAALMALPEAEGEWSAVDCLQHLVDSEKVFQFRVEAFLAGRDFPNFDPRTEGSRPGAQTAPVLAEDFARMRGESLRMLEQLSPADLERTARHAELGIVTLNEMAHNWAAHDLNHTIQAERALMRYFIQGCGPWKRLFTFHFQLTTISGTEL